MKQVKSNTNINQLLQPLPETAQEVICGGGSTSIAVSNLEGTSGGTEFVAPVKIEHGVDGTRTPIKTFFCPSRRQSVATSNAFNSLVLQ